MINNFWIDTNYHDGDFNIAKFALYDGNELLLSAAYNEVPGFALENDYNSPDDNEIIRQANWKAIDTYIKINLGFLPDYTIG